MYRNGFGALCLALSPALGAAQALPGRDLFEFPLGTVVEGGALAVRTGDGFRNPASVILAPTAVARLSVSSLMTGADQGVAGQVLGFAHRGPRDLTFAVSVARAAVSGIVRTDLDPQPLGGDVPYHAVLLSVHAAHRRSGRVTTGLALRYQRGEIDTHRRQALGVDAGVIVDSVAGRDVRVGASTFLWRPGSGAGEGPAFTGAADLRVAGADSLAQVRTSVAVSHAPGYARELAAGASLRYGLLEGRAGVARATFGGRSATRPRLAVALHYARYVVAIAREEGREGLAPVYHFTLVSTFARQ